MFSRKIEDLTPKVQKAYEKFAKKAEAAGIQHMITCTLRTPTEQRALFAQGRRSLQVVNNLRKALGWYLLSLAENENKVTWTLNSRHFPVTQEEIDNGEAKQEDLGKSRAFDIAILKEGRKPTWNAKADVDKDEIPDYLEAAEAGEAAGLIAGARWSTPDPCHFEQKPCRITKPQQEEKTDETV